MKIALVCSHGGHLTELRMLSSAFESDDWFYITYDTDRTQDLDAEAYLLRNINTNPFRMGLAFLKIARVLLAERPDVVLSTGAEIAVPAFYLGALLGCETVFIESWCHVRSRSLTGRIVYPVSDVFLVQWPQLVELYGEKARYEGTVI